MARLRTLSAIALSVALIPAGAAMAQSSGGGRGGTAGSGPGGSGIAGGNASASVGTQTVIDIDFGGGTLPEYYDHLQQRTGVRNIILASEELSDVSMPEVKLSSVLYTDAVKLPNFVTSFSDDRVFGIDEVGSNKSIYAISVHKPYQHVSPDPTTRLKSFDFEGGSLTEFVATLQKIAGTQTVLVRGEAARFTMPPISLENVTLHSVLMALDGDARRLSSGEKLLLSSERRDGVYVVEVISERSASHSPDGPSAVQTMSWSLAALRGQGRLSTEDMLAAIEAAVEVSGGAESSTIRFHEKTSLLLVSAKADTIGTIDGVLAQLHASSDAAKREYDQRQAIYQRLYNLESQASAYRASQERIMRKLNEVRSEGGTASEQLIPILETELIRIEGELFKVSEEAGDLRNRMESPTPNFN